MMASACDRFIWNCGVDISLAVRVCVTPNAKAAKHMPAIPATAVSIIPSDRICTIISDGFAPIARRIPISCVRSFTMTHMMFPMPIMPASRVLKPMKRASSDTPVNRLSTIANCSEISNISIAGSSSGDMAWRIDRTRRMRGLRFDIFSPSLATIITTSTLSPRLKALRKVELGRRMDSSSRPFICISLVWPHIPATTYEMPLISMLSPIGDGFPG